MRVAIITPYYESLNRGNAVAVNRWVKGFEAAGDEVLVLSLESLSVPLSVFSRSSSSVSYGVSSTISSSISSALYEHILSFRPQVIHGIHAYKSGKYLLELANKIRVPIVVSMRGTDVWSDLIDPEHKEVIKNVLEASSCITVITEDMKNEVVKLFPYILEKIKIIPQGVKSPANSTFLISNLIPKSITAYDQIILFPANIRKEKNILYPIESLATLEHEFPLMRLVYAGPVLDKNLKIELDIKASKYAWIRYIGALPHEKMYGLYKLSFAVINCSLHEGMPNAILEGMAAGKPVLVFNNTGAQKLIIDGKTGFLFETQEELSLKLRRLLLEPELAEKIGKNGAQEVLNKYSVEKEIAAYRNIYCSLINNLQCREY